MKKTFYAAIIGGFFLVFGIFYACSKNGDTTTTVDKSQYEKIGIAHNMAVKYALERIDPNEKLDARLAAIEPLLKEALPDAYKSYKASGVTENKDFTRMMMDRTQTPDFEGFTKSLKLSSDLTEALLKVIDLVNQSLAISTFEHSLGKLEDEAIRKLQSNDLVLFLTYTSIAKYSTRLWYPKSRGGESGFYRYFSSRRNNSLFPSNRLQTRDTECFDEFGEVVVRYDSTGVPCPGGTTSNGTPPAAGFNWARFILVDCSTGTYAALSNLATTAGAGAIPNPVTGAPPAAWAFLFGAAAGSTTVVIAYYIP